MLPVTRDWVQSFSIILWSDNQSKMVKMHENAAPAENLKSERDSLFVPDIEIVAIMENGNHSDNLPHRTQQQVSCNKYSAGLKSGPYVWRFFV